MSNPFPPPGALPEPPLWAPPQPVAPPRQRLLQPSLRPGPGALRPGWRTALITCWFGVLAAIGSVWQAGRDAGISPWWTGPETNPRSFAITALPFICAVIPLLFAYLNRRVACWSGVISAMALAACGLVDANRYTGLGLAQVAIAVCALLVSAAALSGRIRQQ